MKVIIGLGNPGREYARTRHNIGFRIIEALCSAQGATFKDEKDLGAEIAECRIEGMKVVLAKPQTFMNRSGFSVQKLLQYFHASPTDCWIVHDDIDLPLGKIKVQHNRSSAGHRGVEDIIRALGTQALYRFRVGIDSRLKNSRKPGTNRFVMAQFSKADETVLKTLIPQVRDLLIEALSSTPERAMSVFGIRKNGT